MEILQYLLHGFSVALTPYNLLFAFIGCLVGTLVGVLPGLGPPATLAMLLPLTFSMNSTTAMIMMCSVFYGAQYGGSTTSILINLPGETSSVMTCLDGYQMARKGRAGAALGISAIGSFVAGTLSVVGLMLVAPPLADFALSFGPPEYFALMLFGLMTLVFLGGKSLIKALLSGLFGFILGIVGSDPVQGVDRFIFGQPELIDGISFVVVVMGLFGIGEIMINLESSVDRKLLQDKIKGLWPNRQDLKDSAGPIFRGTVIGFFKGILPGAGATISTMLSYSVEKILAKHPEEFGKGAIQGVAGPEAANNASVGGQMIPLFTLGIPGGSSTAIMLGAMMMWGLRPGPLLFEQHSEFVWGIIASMYIGNVILLVLNLPLVPLFAQTLKTPAPIMYAIIILVCIIGTFSLNSSFLDLWLLLIFGVMGYLLKKLDFPMAPIVLALVLGPMLERALYQSLTMSQGNIMIFFQRPISGIMMGLTFLLLLFPLIKWFYKSKSQFASSEKE